MIIDEIREGLEKLEMLEKITDYAETNWDKEPENKEYENKFDAAYKNEYKAFIELTEKISILLNITSIDARNIVKKRREKIKSIINY